VVLTAAWQSYIASFHDRHPGITEAALEHSRHREWGTGYDWLAQAVPSDAQVVLDLACGSAPMHPRLAGATYLGVDRSTSELRVAREKERGHVHSGDVTALPVADSSVDAVVMSMAFMLVPQAQVLGEVHRVLRPGGTFAALVPATGPVRLTDLLPVAVLAAPLGGPGRMPQQIHTGQLAKRLVAAGLRPERRERRRFPFPVRGPQEAELAVRCLYTPGSDPRQRERAARWLSWLAPVELPVPLLRFVATK
jgi:SAM-dependent methyltransferase